MIVELVQTLCGTETSRASTNDENVNFAVYKGQQELRWQRLVFEAHICLDIVICANERGD